MHCRATRGHACALLMSASFAGNTGETRVGLAIHPAPHERRNHGDARVVLVAGSMRTKENRGRNPFAESKAQQVTLAVRAASLVDGMDIDGRFWMIGGYRLARLMPGRVACGIRPPAHREAHVARRHLS